MNERLSAVVLTVVMVLSVATPTVVAGADTGAETADLAPSEFDGEGESSVSSPSEQMDAPPNGSSAGNGAGEPPGKAIGEGLKDANGTVTVVVRLDEASLEHAKFPPGNASDRARQRLEEVAEKTQRPVLRHARSKRGITVVKRFWITNAVVVRVDLDRVDLEELAGVENVQRLHRNFEVQIPNGTAVSNSTDSGTAAIDNTTATGTTSNGHNTTYGVDRVNATEVWQRYDTRGDGVRVAVLDTGVNVDHPDIELHTEDPSDPTYPGGWAEFESDGTRVEGSTPYDSGTFYGHGTHVSGTVAGGNASGEYIGVAPNVSLMHGLVLREGSGSFAQIIAGMEWAVKNDADVVSMSIGSSGYYPSFVEPVRNAEAAGTVVVAAEGNTRGETSTPGAVYDTISVGVTDSENNVPYFGGGVRVDTRDAWYPFAPDDWPEQYVVPDVAAPGVDVKSATRSGFAESYYKSSGTSMSAPHVAGVTALALSAAENASVSQTKEAVTTSGWKPTDCDEEFGGFSGLDGECNRDGKDIGYGHGIVDAATAADRLAADGGVDGTVTDSAGDPVPNATVELDGFDVVADADGQYTLRESAGTYTVTADGFGYEPRTKTVTVSQGEFTRLDFALNETLVVDPASPQDGAVRPGNNTSVTLRAAHVDSWTVSRAGEFDGDATLYVDGQRVAFGETVQFDDYTGPITVTVSVADDAGGGNLSLVHDVTGAGESTTVTTGPTMVTDRIYRVGVVGAYKSGYAPGVQQVLDRELPRNYRLSFVPADDVLNVTDRYDVFVVQNFGGDPSPEFVRSFERATDSPETGVVYLDQQRELYPYFERPRTSDAISQLEEATNDPKRTAGDSTFATDELDYRIERAHPIFAGVGDPGENVTIQTRDSGIEYTYFEEYSGTTLASVSQPEAGYSSTAGAKGPGLAVDESTGTVLAASLGRYSAATNDQFTNASDRILANAVLHLSTDPQATVAERPPEQADRGEEAVTTFEVTDLQAVTVSVAERSTLSADDLALYVDGERAEFGSRLTFENRTTDEFTVTVASEADGANGSVALETTFESAGADAPLTVRTGPTAIYDPPLVVGQDVDSFEAAMTMVQPGGTVHVANGTYVEQTIVDKPGVTITALPGAEPVLKAPETMERYSSVLRVEEPNVTVEGLRVELDAADIDMEDGAFDNYVGVELRYSPHDATIRDVTVDGAGTGIAVGNPAREGGFEPNVTDSTISGVLINGSSMGIQVGIGTNYEQTSGLVVEDTRITNVQPTGTFSGTGYGVFHEYGRNVTYTNVTVANCRAESQYGECTGFTGYAALDTTFEDGTIRNAETGIDFGGVSRQLVVRNNTIVNTTTGVVVEGETGDTDYATGRVTGNDIDATTGIVFQDKSDPTVAVHYNDLSDAEQPVTKTTSSFFGDPPAYDPDVRLNYFGPRGPTDAETREGRYDPFLTEPPAEVSRNETTAIATDLVLPANETRTIGIPGPTEQTVADVLGAEFEGSVESYDAETDTWDTVDVGSGVELRPLDVLRVTPATGTVAVLTFRSQPGDSATDGAEGDGSSANSNGRVVLDGGTNVVSSATYDAVESAFVTPSGSVSTVTPLAPGPESQLGPRSSLDGTHETNGSDAGPEVSPFTGYVVHSEHANPIEVSLEANPTVYELHTQLGLERPALTGLDTNLTAASSYAVEFADTAEANGTTLPARTAVNESPNGTYGQLVDVGLAAATERANETTDRTAIERAVVEAVQEEADELGVDLTPRQRTRIVDRVLDTCYRHEDCRPTTAGK